MVTSWGRGRATRGIGGNGSFQCSQEARGAASAPGAYTWGGAGAFGFGTGSGTGRLQESGTAGSTHTSCTAGHRRCGRQAPPLDGRRYGSTSTRSALRPGNDLVCTTAPVSARLKPEYLCAAA